MVLQKSLYQEFVLCLMIVQSRVMDSITLSKMFVQFTVVPRSTKFAVDEVALVLTSMVWSHVADCAVERPAQQIK